MDPYDVASLDAEEDFELGDLASWHTPRLSSPLTLESLTESQAIHHIGRLKFSDYQLEYVLVNLVHAKGTNTTSQVVSVLRYKWPKQFKMLLDSDLEMVTEWVSRSSSIEVNRYKNREDGRGTEG